MTGTTTSKKKTAVVTGGAGGIGKAIAQHLIRKDYTVFLADIHAKNLEDAVRESGPDALALKTDITDWIQVEGMVKQVIETCGRIDVLVNNAGMVITQPFDQCPVETLILENRLNYVAALYCTKAVLPHMQAASGGTVVSVASLGGIIPMADSPGYTASKAALRGLMLSLHMTLAPFGIHVGCVNPGAVDTPMLLFEAKNNGSALNFLQKPLSPGDVARAVWHVIHKKKIEVCLPGHEGVSSKLGSFFPGLLPKLMPWLLKAGERNRKTYLNKKQGQL